MAQAAAVIEQESDFFLDSLRLHRRWVCPLSPARARLAILHGYGDHSGRHLHLMRWLAERGIACHALDFRGQGRSAGRRAYVQHWDDYLDDMRCFLSLPELLEPRRPDCPLLVLGHSHGGLIAAAAAVRGELPCAAVVLVSPFLASLRPIPLYKLVAAHLTNRLLPWVRMHNGLRNTMMTRDPQMLADTSRDPLVDRSATARWYFGMRQAQAQVLSHASQLRLPLLTLVSGADPIADPAVTIRFHESTASTDKDLHLYPNHLHELLREMDRERVFAEILAFIDRIVSPPA